ILSKLAATGVLALGLGIALAGSPANASAAIKVTPSTGLSDGAVVTVSGVGLQAGDVYHVGQCAAVSDTSYACNSPESADVAVAADGSLSTPLTVRKTFQGVAADGSVHPIDCS
ncbi:enediyne antibiotic chromoprotein, partial [Microbispora sp. ZYX-F-249]